MLLLRAAELGVGVGTLQSHWGSLKLSLLEVCLASARGPDWVGGSAGVSGAHWGCGPGLLTYHPPPASFPLTSLGPQPAFSKQEEGTLTILWSCPINLADRDPEALRQYNDKRYTLKGRTRAQWLDFALENWLHDIKKKNKVFF